MTMRKFLFVAAAIAAVLVTQSSAQALTMSECSAKYKDAKTAGTLNGATQRAWLIAEAERISRG